MAESTKKPKRKPGRPATKTMPLIPDTPENVAKAVMSAPPNPRRPRPAPSS